MSSFSSDRSGSGGLMFNASRIFFCVSARTVFERERVKLIQLT
jgi:hypothetical protein